VRVALTRSVPPSIDRCELTHLQREPIDYTRAVREHAAYEEALRRAGCRVERLPDLPGHPDSVFVEDTAVVFERIAVIARPGAASRREEVASTVRALERHRPLAYIQPPATLDGGDVLVTPGRVFVGVSGRTTAGGAHQLATILAPHGIDVVPVVVTGCLHLKSAVTFCGDLRPEGPNLRPEGGNLRPKGGNLRPKGGNLRPEGRSYLLINPAWVDSAPFAEFELVDVDPSEPHAANVLAVGDRVICAEAHVRTRRRLEAHGIVTSAVPASELAKAEGGVTCGSIIFTAGSQH